MEIKKETRESGKRGIAANPEFTIKGRLSAKLETLKIGDTIDKKELITELWGYYDYFVMRSFDVHFHAYKQKTGKEFVTKNSIITREE